MQNRKSNDPSLVSCIRLSPYKKCSPSALHQDITTKYKFTPSYCAVCDMETIAQNRTVVNSGHHHRVTTRSSVSALNSSPIKDNLLYEPYKMRPIKPSISIVHCKHLPPPPPPPQSTKDNNDLTTSPQHNFHHRVKTEFKSNNKSHDVLSSPNRRNGTSPTVQITSENTSPKDVTTLNYVTKPDSRKILEESSIDALNCGQSTFRKVLDRDNKNGYNVGIIEGSHDKHPQYCQIVENSGGKNFKCGNSSCNGSEPLKETHITGNNTPTYTIEKRYREEVALLRGKVRELSKNKSTALSTSSGGGSPGGGNTQTNKILIKKEKLSKNGGEKPRKLPVKRSPVCVKHTPKIIDLHTALQIEDKPGIELREKVIIVENPTLSIINQRHTRQRSKNTTLNEINLPNTSAATMMGTLLPPRTTRSGTSAAHSSSGGSSNVGSPQHFTSKKEQRSSDLQEVNKIVKDCKELLSDIQVNNMTIQTATTPTTNGVQLQTKIRKKTRDLNNSDTESELSDRFVEIVLLLVVTRDLNNSDTESELLDSECSDPDEAGGEEKQINYESVLSELVTIRNDLYLSYPANNEFMRQSPVGESGDTAKPMSVLRPSLFPNVPPYLRFYPHDKAGPKLPASIQRQLKWRLSNITPVIVRKTLLNSGFRLMRAEGTTDNNDWIGIWGKHIKSPLFKQLKDHQKMNHFPGTFQLGRKDRLWRNTQKLQIKFGIKEFDYVPKTYILPQDLKQLRHVWEKGEGIVKWILKPPASARGSGIRVVNKWNQVPKKKPLVVQRYIENPYLINGSKFDLRLYVLLTSFDPLRIYLYPDGLARFASVKYSSDSSTLDNRYMHLTNYSINKLSRDYTANEDAAACQGHKWTIQALWDYLNKNGVNTNKLWSTLEDLVIKTIISGESGITTLLRSNVNSHYNCYELFGIDVLLDEHLKPWLLEVNISPSLHSTSPLDLYVKGPLVQTLLNMAQYHIPQDTFNAATSGGVGAMSPPAINKQQQQRNAFIKNLIGVQHLNNSCNNNNKSNNKKFNNKTTHKQQQSTHSDGASGDNTNGGLSFDIPLSFDNRLYTIHLSNNERLKQNLMTSYQHREDYLDDILTNLTPDDVRHLIIAEDELQAAGKFQRIFPTKNTYHYLTLMESRYYDRLFDAWEHKYSSNKVLGIGLLQACCARKYHLVVPPPPKILKENQQPSMTEKEAADETTVATPVENAVVLPPRHHLPNHYHQVVLPLNQVMNPSRMGGGTTMLEEGGGPSPSQKPRARFVRRRRYVYGGRIIHNSNNGVVAFKHYPSIRYTTSRVRSRSRARAVARLRRHYQQQLQHSGDQATNHLTTTANTSSTTNISITNS